MGVKCVAQRSFECAATLLIPLVRARHRERRCVDVQAVTCMIRTIVLRWSTCLNRHVSTTVTLRIR